MDTLPKDSENVIDFPISLQSRIKALGASGKLTDKTLDQMYADFLQPLILQAARINTTLKALQFEANLSAERHIGLIETSKET